MSSSTSTEQQQQQQQGDEEDVVILKHVTPIYCGACGMPPEYCEYSPDYESHCLPWLSKHHPHLVTSLRLDSRGDNNDKPKKNKTRRTTQERLEAFYQQYVPEKVSDVPTLLEKYEGKEDKLFQALVKKYGPEPEYSGDEEDDSDDEDDDEHQLHQDMAGISIDNDDDKKKKKRRGVGAKKANPVDTRVVIQKISRTKKKSVTIVVGMDTVPNVNLKDVSKAFSKRFAGSSSVKDVGNGKREIIIQGDHMYEVADMVVNKFQVPGHSVFLDIDGEFVPYQE